MKFLTEELQKKNALLIDLRPEMWTVIIADTMGFYSVIGTLSPYWLNCLLGFLVKETLE